MTDRLITADASRVTAAEFVAAFRPQPSKLELLCAELFDATDRARIREIHEEMAALTDVAVKPIGDGWHRAEAA